MQLRTFGFTFFTIVATSLQTRRRMLKIVLQKSVQQIFCCSRWVAAKRRTE